MSTNILSTVSILDALGNPKNMGVVVETPGTSSPVNVPLSASAGSAGTDWSMNSPVSPLIGATVFGGLSDYAAWLLLGTVPVNFGACERRIRNNSTFPILIAFDDGLAGTGSQPTNNHLFLLQPASAASPNDGERVFERFKGRIRVFCFNALAWVSVLEA